MMFNDVHSFPLFSVYSVHNVDSTAESTQQNLLTDSSLLAQVAASGHCLRAERSEIQILNPKVC